MRAGEAEEVGAVRAEAAVARAGACRGPRRGLPGRAEAGTGPVAAVSGLAAVPGAEPAIAPVGAPAEARAIGPPVVLGEA